MRKVCADRMSATPQVSDKATAPVTRAPGNVPPKSIAVVGLAAILAADGWATPPDRGGRGRYCPRAQRRSGLSWLTRRSPSITVGSSRRRVTVACSVSATSVTPRAKRPRCKRAWASRSRTRLENDDLRHSAVQRIADETVACPWTFPGVSGAGFKRVFLRPDWAISTNHLVVRWHNGSVGIPNLPSLTSLQNVVR